MSYHTLSLCISSDRDSFPKLNDHIRSEPWPQIARSAMEMLNLTFIAPIHIIVLNKLPYGTLVDRIHGSLGLASKINRELFRVLERPKYPNSMWTVLISVERIS